LNVVIGFDEFLDGVCQLDFSALLGFGKFERSEYCSVEYVEGMMTSLLAGLEGFSSTLLTLFLPAERWISFTLLADGSVCQLRCQRVGSVRRAAVNDYDLMTDAAES